MVKEGYHIKSLIQVSYDIENLETKKREIGALIAAMKTLNFSEGVIITYDFSGEEKIGKKRIVFIPIVQWLLLSQSSPLTLDS